MRSLFIACGYLGGLLCVSCSQFWVVLVKNVSLVQKVSFYTNLITRFSTTYKQLGLRQNSLLGRYLPPQYTPPITITTKLINVFVGSC